VTIQMKAIEQYHHVVLFIILCEVVLFVDENLVFDYSRSKESAQALRSCATVLLCRCTFNVASMKPLLNSNTIF